MTYTITIHYYDEPGCPIVDEHDTLEDAMDAWTDANWAACHAPPQIGGDIQRIVLKQGTTVIKSRGYP